VVVVSEDPEYEAKRRLMQREAADAELARKLRAEAVKEADLLRQQKVGFFVEYLGDTK
jgi:hypothetical protein